MVVTYRGMSIRFNEDEVEKSVETRRAFRIKLKDDDKAISLDVVRGDADLFLVTDTGFGKRVKTDRFNQQGRGGQACGNQVDAARGFVVAAFMAGLDDEYSRLERRRPHPHAVREVSSQGRDAPACA